MFPLHEGTSARPEGGACDSAHEVWTRGLGGQRPQDPAPGMRQNGEIQDRKAVPAACQARARMSKERGLEPARP